MSFRFASALVVALLLSSFTWSDEPVDIDAAARAYRIRVYRTFRTNRAEYDRRIDTGKEVLSAWTGGGSPAEEQDVLKWFLSATEASANGAIVELPVLAVMDTLNSRRLAYNKSKRGSRRSKKRRQVSRVAKKRSAAPSQTVASQTSKSTKSGGLSGLMGQLVNQGMNLIGNNQDRQPTPASSTSQPVASDSPDRGSSSENLIALKNDDATSSSDSDYEAKLQSLNETIIGQNLVVEETRSKLSSEWDFDPTSAEELVANLETLASNELDITRRIGLIPPSLHSSVDPMVSVNELLGDVNERLLALQDGRAAFSDSGFQNDDAQGLLDRIEKIRKELKI